MKEKKSYSNYVGIAILAGAMIFAVARVTYNQMTFEAPDVTTIKICHWQLEAGFREALQELIDEYEAMYLKKTGKKVRILQMPISERGYKQFMNTSLIGGTAPDILEKGFSSMASDASYVVRFFEPLGKYVREPNPYNEGTALEGIPWNETVVDGMQNAYDKSLLDYYFIPFSMFTVRVYYNKYLYREITGTDQGPKTFAEMIAVCEQIKKFSSDTGRGIVPIAGGKYQGKVFIETYAAPFYFGLIPKLDLDMNGTVDALESYHAYQKKQWSFLDDRMLSSWECMADLASNFQGGWLAALRDDTMFLFVQGRAVMIASGSWDAPSFKKMIRDKFKIGVFDFPMPTDYPKYSKYVKAPRSEASMGGGIPWSITRQSKHKDLCVDFLRFCTTKANNERFNKAITWIPVIQGAEMVKDLEPFRPRLKGFSGDFQTSISTAVALKEAGNQWNLFTKKMSPKEYGEILQKTYEKTAADGFKDKLDIVKRDARNLDRIMAAILVRRFITADSDATREEEAVRTAQILDSSLVKSHEFKAHAARFENSQKGNDSEAK